MTLFNQLSNHIKKDKGVALAVVVRGPADFLGAKALIPATGEPHGPLLEMGLGREVMADAQNLIQAGHSATKKYDLAEAEIEIFYDVHCPAPRLIIVGAVHIASDLIHFAKPLGLRTYLVDPRTAFATSERFPHVDEMFATWPDEALPEIGLTRETSVVVVTHDPKLDDPALKIALPSPAQYVGALGSLKTHKQRIKRLGDEGVALADLERLHAPIGLNIGGRTPAEIALSIIAEIVAVRNEMPLVQRK